MWKENSENLLQTAAILLSLNLLLVGRMLVKQSWKTLVCHSFLLLLCLDSGSNVQTVVNFPMERAMWNPPEPARAHSPQRSDIFGQLSLQAMSVYICETWSSWRPQELSPTQMNHRIMSDRAIVWFACFSTVCFASTCNRYTVGLHISVG